MDKSKFQFKGFFIKRSLIEHDETKKASGKFSIDFEPKGSIIKKDANFRLQLGIKITDTEKVINIDITAIADYTFSEEINTEELNQYFYVNAPALLFPYIRAYITTLTNLSGMKSINLPTLNLTSLGAELKKNTIIIQ